MVDFILFILIFIMKIKLLNLISIFDFSTMLKIWIKELNLTIEAKEVLLEDRGLVH